jgi:hypothetical protein
VQLTLAENDPAHLDTDFWLGLMRDTKANATCLSAGGYIAYYPTTIPFHHRSTYLGDTDPFGTLVEGARGLGMHVMARVDPHAVHADAAEAHPEWLARDADGEPIRHWSYDSVWLTCAFTPYHREFITEVAREIVREYDVDAVFANRWEGYRQISYSEGARRSFRDEAGLDLPRGASDDAWPVYVDWRRRKLSELVALWDQAVRDVRPHARFIPNLGSLGARDLDRALIEKHYPMFVLDRQGRSGNEPPWVAGRTAKRNRAVFPDRPAQLIASVGPEHHVHRWKDSVAPPAEVQTWIVDGFAQGAHPWATKFNATISDSRWVEPIVDVMTLHARLEPVLEGMPITAEIALLDPSRQTSHEDGLYQALVEARLPFELVAATELERLHAFKVLVVANAGGLDDAQREAIRAYVASGGSLVAAYEPGGLGDVLGVRPTRPSRQVKNNYVAMMGEHPLSDGFAGARRIIGGVHVVDVEAVDDAEVPFRFVPDFPDLPMEEVYAREAPDAPAVVCRTHANGGRTVHLAFDVGATFWEVLQSDHGLLIANAVRWALGGEPEVVVDGPGLVDVAVRKDADRVAVAVVNLTNPMAMRGAIRETLPLPPQRVSVAVPDGDVSARLLVADVEVEPVVANGRAEVTIPSAELLEVVTFEWRTA